MEIKEKLAEKLKNEFEEFTKQILEQDKDEIMSRGLEIAIKALIKNILTENYTELNDEQIEELLMVESVLDFIYESFMDENEYMNIEEVLAEYISELMDSYDSEEEQD